MTNTEAIDKVEAWLLQQEERCTAADDSTRCAYWRPDGNMCAVGALLGEELAREVTASDMRNYSVTRILTSTEGELADRVCEALCGVSVKLLQDLQLLHDAETRGPKLAQEFSRLRLIYAERAS